MNMFVGRFYFRFTTYIFHKSNCRSRCRRSECHGTSPPFEVILAVGMICTISHILFQQNVRSVSSNMSKDPVINLNVTQTSLDGVRSSKRITSIVSTKVPTILDFIDEIRVRVDEKNIVHNQM